MSYFNAEQQDWLRYLASLPREKKCACGWHPRGECPRCPPDDEPPLDQVKRRRNDPMLPGLA